MIDRRPAWLSGVLTICAALLAGLAIGPAVLLVLISLQPAGGDMSSLKGAGEFVSHTLTGAPVDPATGQALAYKGATTRNFQDAWEKGNLAGPMVNSVIVTATRAVCNVLLAALAAYPLARMKFKGRSWVFVLILATMMIPDQVIVVPMFRTVVQMGLADTLIGVIIPFSVSALGITMCKQAFEQIPASLEEAARIDGASTLQVWWHVMLPLSAPTLATLALFSVIGAWSELLWPLVVLQESKNYTLPVAVNQLLGEFAGNVRLAYAGAVLSLVPIVVVFVLSQRFLKPQMFAGGVKG